MYLPHVWFNDLKTSQFYCIIQKHDYEVLLKKCIYNLKLFHYSIADYIQMELNASIHMDYNIHSICIRIQHNHMELFRYWSNKVFPIKLIPYEDKTTLNFWLMHLPIWIPIHSIYMDKNATQPYRILFTLK